MGRSGHNQDRKSGKTGNYRATYMFIGYANNYEGDYYHRWNPVTKRVREKHDVIFIQRMFYEVKNSKEIMKEPAAMLQVPHRNENINDDSDDESVIQDKEVLNPNDLSGLETREGTRVTFKADSNAKNQLRLQQQKTPLGLDMSPDQAKIWD